MLEQHVTRYILPATHDEHQEHGARFALAPRDVWDCAVLGGHAKSAEQLDATERL